MTVAKTKAALIWELKDTELKRILLVVMDFLVGTDDETHDWKVQSGLVQCFLV